MMTNNYFDRQERIIGKEVGEKIKNTKILVVGAGAGGNEVLKNLALMGFGIITIVDFDPIEDSNLSKSTLFSANDIGKPKAEIAAKALVQISLHESPVIKGINAKIQDIGKQIFLNSDIVICCVDTMDARAYINDWCVRLKKPLFEMGFENFFVQISFFPNEQPTDACLREVIGFGDFVGTRHGCSNLKMADTKLVYTPTIQVSAAFAGVFVATEIILFLKGECLLKNKILQYAANNHRILEIDCPQNEKCHLHEKVNYQFVETSLNATTNSFKDLLVELGNQTNANFYINWYEPFIYSMKCESCGENMLIKRFESDVNDKERWCSECRGQYNPLVTPKKVGWLTNKELNLTNQNCKFFLELPMSDFGIKEKDIIIVDNYQSINNKILVLI